jgi:hypothetical protein
LVVSFAIRSDYSFLNFAVRHTVSFYKKKFVFLEKKKEGLEGILRAK